MFQQEKNVFKVSETKLKQSDSNTFFGFLLIKNHLLESDLYSFASSPNVTINQFICFQRYVVTLKNFTMASEFFFVWK